jgi:DNA-binding HxlR family transcriptional regulator
MIRTNLQVTDGTERARCDGLAEPLETLTREVLARVSARWSLWTLHTLASAEAPARFTRVHEAMPGVSQKMLTQTLRHLERDGLVVRIVHAEMPPRVEYQLTPLGRELLARVDPVVEWARMHAHQFEAAQQRFDAD